MAPKRDLNQGTQTNWLPVTSGPGEHLESQKEKESCPQGHRRQRMCGQLASLGGSRCRAAVSSWGSNREKGDVLYLGTVAKTLAVNRENMERGTEGPTAPKKGGLPEKEGVAKAKYRLNPSGDRCAAKATRGRKPAHDALTGRSEWPRPGRVRRSQRL